MKCFPDRPDALISTTDRTNFLSTTASSYLVGQRYRSSHFCTNSMSSFSPSTSSWNSLILPI
jgi:hypothetical protein